MKNPFSKPSKGFITALDIGATKVCCWVVQENSDNQTFQVTGVGHQASYGISGGYITDMGALEAAIAQTVHEAECTSSETIRDVFLNVDGQLIRSSHQDVAVPITGSTIHRSDITNLFQELSCPENHRLIHSLPLQYELNGQSGIQDPIGMAGQRLKASIHTLSGSISPLRNLLLCLQHCHLGIQGFVSSAYASGLACLVNDEKKLGATLIDIGGGSTHIASFLSGRLIFTDCVPLGGNHITHDVARVLETSISNAERLKVVYGASVLSESDRQETIPVYPLGDNQKNIPSKVPRSHLIRIIQPRIEEILFYVVKSLKQSGIEPLCNQRIVLTGGTSQLAGIRDLASIRLGRNVHLSSPYGFEHEKDICKPDFSTIAGLIRYASLSKDPKTYYEAIPQASGSLGVFRKITSWLKENL